MKEEEEGVDKKLELNEEENKEKEMEKKNVFERISLLQQAQNI